MKGNGISCKIQHFKLWRRVLKEKYPEAIIGKQRKNSISSLKQNLEKDVKVGEIKYDKIYDNQILSRESDSLYDLN